MIICLCNDVSQQDIVDELKKNKSVEESLAALGVGSACGICLFTVKEMFKIDTNKLLEYYME